MLYGVDGSGMSAPRLSITNVQLFESPMGALGVGADATPLGGVLGGDNLSRFAVGLDYRGATPTMTLTSNVTPCSCELAPSCSRSTCFAVLPFSLQGGQDTSLQNQTRIVIGNDQYNYPPTRVLLDGCIEPYPDPVSADEPCVPPGRNPADCPLPPYLPSGLDVKLLVATGFPGLALSASAYDRLRGAGAAEALLAGPTVTLSLGDPADQNVAAAKTTLGRATSLPSDPGASAMALVSSEFFYGPCASLARSRRMRRFLAKQTPADTAAGTNEPTCPLDAGRACGDPIVPEPHVKQCTDNYSDDRCSDYTAHSPTPAVIELTRPLDVYVLPDLTPLFVGVNADVRTTAPTVDGIIGGDALARMVGTIDYPGNRFIARCASADGCLAYPRLSIGSNGDCGFCTSAWDLINNEQCTVDPMPGSFACPPAP